MNTKTFAQQSRNLLMDGVAKKLLYWGFNPKGEVLETPEEISGGYSFRGEVFDDPDVPHLWDVLKKAVEKKGIEVVVEEAAYTWFNRLMALRIMAKNGYEPSLLENAEGLEHTPILLQKARQGQVQFLNTKEQERLQKIIGDYSKDQEAFSLLLVGYCHSHNSLNKVFGKLDDYTELLLPDNMLQDQGFLHLLNTTDAISDEEYQQVELIGWLYQFYISERKDEVFKAFKKKKKAEAKDIPAATQIFTPNWIVKYMVENTAGKLWLDHKPNSPLKDQMKYLVKNDGHPEPVEGALSPRAQSRGLISNVEELTLIDPACGSGHILVEGFELLYQMYLEEYYTPEEAVQTIFEKNLYGLDIDERAAQLATFAVMLKAAKVYPDVWDKNWQLNIYAMPEADSFSQQEVVDFLGEEGKDHIEALEKALQLMQQAKNLGSVMQLNLSEEAVAFIAQRYQAIKQEKFLDFNLTALLPKLDAYIPVLLTLSRKFTAVVANPPYMGQKSMNTDLKNYLNANYPISKSDLFAVFIEAMTNMLQENARVGCITMESWMFLSSYEKLRHKILDNYLIASLAHFGWHIIGIAFGTATLILEKSRRIKKGEYSYLTINDIDREKNIPFEFPLKDNGRYAVIPQTNFEKIPGSPIAYWVSPETLNNFEKGITTTDFGIAKQGLVTANNDLFIKNWQEVNFKKIGFNIENTSEAIESKLKWFPLNKAGTFRKWYGNQNFLVNYENDAADMKKYQSKLNQGWTVRIKSREYYFKESISWGLIGAGTTTFREYQKGFIFDVSALTFYPIKEKSQILAYLNSKVFANFSKILNPTLNLSNGVFSQIPLCLINQSKTLFTVDERTRESIYLSKKDWDSRETSWDFEQSPLLNESNSLEKAYKTWQEEVTQDFFQLHSNEEELNRIFIGIYGLQDELTPEVALKDITILQEELNGKDLQALEPTFREKGAETISLPIDKAEVIQQLISYAIGVFMGRYRLDQPGLHIAHPNPSSDEIASYSYKGKSIEIDEDAILPVMGTKCNFPDDVLQQFNQFLDTIWGGDTRTGNFNFIQDCLDKDLEKFLIKDFYKYHCGMYKKKPIYWLFASPKGAFQVLVYMHRMNAFTVEKVRANYLLEHLKNLRSQESMLLSNESNLSTEETKRLDQIRKDINECETYDSELKEVADQQIEFDLDDGVSVNYKKFEPVLAKIK